MKKLLSIMLAVVLVMSLLPVLPAMADTDYANSYPVAGSTTTDLWLHENRNATKDGNVVTIGAGDGEEYIWSDTLQGVYSGTDYVIPFTVTADGNSSIGYMDKSSNVTRLYTFPTGTNDYKLALISGGTNGAEYYLYENDVLVDSGDWITSSDWWNIRFDVNNSSSNTLVIDFGNAKAYNIDSWEAAQAAPATDYTTVYPVASSTGNDLWANPNANTSISSGVVSIGPGDGNFYFWSDTMRSGYSTNPYDGTTEVVIPFTATADGNSAIGYMDRSQNRTSIYEFPEGTNDYLLALVPSDATSGVSYYLYENQQLVASGDLIAEGDWWNLDFFVHNSSTNNLTVETVNQKVYTVQEWLPIETPTEDATEVATEEPTAAPTEEATPVVTAAPFPTQVPVTEDPNATPAPFDVTGDMANVSKDNGQFIVKDETATEGVTITVTDTKYG